MAFTPRRMVRALLVPTCALALVAGPVVVTTSAAAAAVRPHSVDPGLRTHGHHGVRVVVSGTSMGLVRGAVLHAGGTNLKPLAIIEGVSATVPADALNALGSTPGVTAVTADRSIHLTANGWDDSISASAHAWTSQATATWAQTGNRGTGIGIAVLDTGVSAVGDLAGRLVQGPDFSGENNNTVDSFGHGTVMAGIAAGSGLANGASAPRTGIAPGATIISVKLAGRNGATDVSTVLAGLSWVGAFKDTYNIRVLNISWGTPSTQDPLIDPLNFAVERLWTSGVTVIAAAGNSGPNPGTIIKPGDDPLVVTVGAYDDKGDSSAANDTVPAWSSQGPTAQGRMKPDLVAPGRTIITTRAPGSLIETQNPQALIGSAYIKGSGTSEATAVTSGAAALLLAAHPSWTPDQVKYALTSTASRIPGVATTLQGAGRLQTKSANNQFVGLVLPQAMIATGLGQIDRGLVTPLSITCQDNVVRPLEGNATSWCSPWSSSAWTSSAWTSSAWTSSAWTSSAWTSSAWTSSAWTSSAWTSSAWTSSAWTSSAWTSSAWTSSAWTSSAWTSSAWTSSAWTSSAWTSSAWTSSAWTSNDYDNDANPSPADGTAGTSYPGGFATAFYGNQPKYGRHVAGEVSALLNPLGLG